jgi:hypothetical protein
MFNRDSYTYLILTRHKSTVYREEETLSRLKLSKTYPNYHYLQVYLFLWGDCLVVCTHPITVQICQIRIRLLRRTSNTANVFWILSSLPLLPSHAPTSTEVFGSYLSSFILNNHCIAGACLPIHTIGEVSWEPKRRWAWASLCSILLAIG